MSVCLLLDAAGRGQLFPAERIAGRELSIRTGSSERIAVTITDRDGFLNVISLIALRAVCETIRLFKPVR